LEKDYNRSPKIWESLADMEVVSASAWAPLVNPGRSAMERIQRVNQVQKLPSIFTSEGRLKNLYKKGSPFLPLWVKKVVSSDKDLLQNLGVRLLSGEIQKENWAQKLRKSPPPPGKGSPKTRKPADLRKKGKTSLGKGKTFADAARGSGARKGGPTRPEQQGGSLLTLLIKTLLQSS